MSVNSDEVIGKQIELLRARAGMSQGELSEKLRAAGLNWSQGTLSRVETGGRPIRFAEALVVAEVLEISALELSPPEREDLESMAMNVEKRLEQQREKLRLAESGLRSTQNRIDDLRAASRLARNPEARVRIRGSVGMFLSTLEGLTSSSGKVRRDYGLADVLELLGLPRSQIDASFAQARKEAGEVLLGMQLDAPAVDTEDEVEDLADTLLSHVTHRPDSLFYTEAGVHVAKSAPDLRKISEGSLEKQLVDEAASSLFSQRFPNVEFVYGKGIPEFEWLDDGG